MACLWSVFLSECVSVWVGVSYLPLCLTLNPFWDETSSTWASLGPETRHVMLVGRLYVLAASSPSHMGYSPKQNLGQILVQPCWEPRQEILPITKVVRKRPDRQRRIRPRGTPWTCSSIYPQPRICLSYYIMPFTNSSVINGGYPGPPFSGKVNLGL